MEYTSFLISILDLSSKYDLFSTGRLADILFHKSLPEDFLGRRRNGSILSKQCFEVIMQKSRIAQHSGENVLKLERIKDRLDNLLRTSTNFLNNTNVSGIDLLLDVKNKLSKTYLELHNVFEELENSYNEFYQSVKRIGAELETYFENRNMPNLFLDKDKKEFRISIVLESVVSSKKYYVMKNKILQESNLYETATHLVNSETNEESKSSFFSIEIDLEDYHSDEESDEDDYIYCYENVDSHIQRENSIYAKNEEDNVNKMKKFNLEYTTENDDEDIEKYVYHRTRTFILVEDLVDVHLMCLILALVALNVSVLLELKIKTREYMKNINNFASAFVRTWLPLMERVLGFEPSLLNMNIFNLTFQGLGTRNCVDEIFYRIIYKLRLLDGLFSSADIFLFPKMINAHQNTLKSISFSHVDPLILLTSGYDGLIKIWDTRTGQILGLFVGHRSIVPWCTFSSDDSFIVSCSFDTTVKVWQSKTGRCLRTLSGHEDSVMSADLSSDDKLILSASMDSTVRLWDVGTGTCFRLFRGHAPNTWVKSVRFMPDNKNFVSAGLDKHLVFWNLVDSNEGDDTQQQPFLVDDEHTDYILDLDIWIGSKTAYLITTSKDCSQRLFNLNTYGLNKTFKRKTGQSQPYSNSNPGPGAEVKNKPTAWASSVAFSPDGKYFVTAALDNSIVVTCTTTGKVVRRLRVQNQATQTVIFSQDGKNILCGASNGKLQIIRL